MGLNIYSAKLTGSPGPSGWAQVHEFKPEDEEKLQLRGHLFAVISTSKSEEGINSVASGRELLTRFHEEYFGNTAVSTFTALKGALEKVISEFQSSWGEVEISACAIVSGIVYSAAGGGAQVAVFRDGMFAKILESTKEMVVSASGYPRNDDILILSTRNFFETVPVGVMRASFSGKNLTAAVEAFAPIVYSRKDLGNLGAVFVGFSEENQAEVKLPKKIVGEEKNRIVSNLISFGNTLKNIIASKIKTGFPERKIYVGTEPYEEDVVPQTKKNVVFVGILLLVLLVVSIGFGIRQQRIKSLKSKYEPKLSQARHDLEEAESLFALDPKRARELFINSKNIIDQLLAEKISNPQIKELKGKIDEKQGSILGEYKILPNLFIDLTLLSDGFVGDKLAAGVSKVYVLDKNGKKVVGAAISTKKTEIIAGPDQIASADSLAVYEDRVFTISTNGVYEASDKGKLVIEKSWSGNPLIYAYAGNIYVLDQGGSTILRFPGASGVFGARQVWLSATTKIDISGLSGWSINGSVWLAYENGRIQKLSLGKKDAFQISGVSPSITGISGIFTGIDFKYLYILDKEGKRVVVLAKSGDYIAQYSDDLLGSAKDLVVSEKEKKIIFLTDGKLYSIELKHL